MGVVFGMESQFQAQSQAQSIEVIKTDNAIVYVRKENGVTIIEAFSRQKQKPYEIWALHRDEKIKKLLHKYHEALDKYMEIKVQIDGISLTIKKLRQLLRQMQFQDEILHKFFIEQLENEIKMLRDIREGLKLKAKETKAQVNALRRKFEQIRKLAMKQFEEYQPQHPLPISDWKKRIETIVATLKAYEKNIDIGNLMVFKKLITQKPWRKGNYARIKLSDIEKSNDYYIYTGWIEMLNEIAINAYEDMLERCLDYHDNWNTKKCGKFKKPSLVKILQNYIESIDWNSVMKALEAWTKVRT